MLGSQGEMRKQRPWLLYHNEQDPYQQTNLCQRADGAALQAKLDKSLSQ